MMSISPTEQPSLESCLAGYETELKRLEGDKPPPDSLLGALLARDRVVVALSGNPASPQTAQRLVSLDHRLRKTAPGMRKADWDTWQQSLNPPADRWWWRLDKTHAQTEGKRDLPWMLLAGLLMLGTLSLAAEIVRRMWGGGPDPLSVVSTVFTLVLTGTPLTKSGRELAGELMKKIGLPIRYLGEMLVGAASLTCIVMLSLFLALPAVARAYNNRGVGLLQTGDLTGAQRAFARAVSIKPDYYQAYYNLADAYVEISNYDQAGSLYNKTLAADRTFDWAYNGLGYVLILQGEPERAISVLYTGLDLAQDDAVRVALWTNLGRAYLEAERYHEAEAALVAALALDVEEAAAHCNLALAAEGLDRSEDEVALNWENCLRYADVTTPRGQELAAMARAHLQQLEE